jgi:hypothetical protein
MSDNTPKNTNTLFANYLKTQEKVEKVESDLVKSLNSVERIIFNFDQIEMIEGKITDYYLNIIEIMDKEGVKKAERCLYLQMTVFNGNKEDETKDSYPTTEIAGELVPVGIKQVMKNNKKDFSASQSLMAKTINRFSAWSGKYYNEDTKKVEKTAKKAKGKAGAKGKSKDQKNGKVYNLKEVLSFLGGLLETEENEEIVESFNKLAVHFKQQDLAI